MKQEAIGEKKTVNSVALELLAQEEHLNASIVILVQLRTKLAVTVATVWSGNGMTQTLDLVSPVGTTPTK